MRTAALVSFALAAGLAGAALAQEPAAQPAPPPAAPATQPAPAPAPTQPSATPPAATTPAPAAEQPAAPPAAPEPPPPALPTTGDGAVIINVLEKVCVPLVRGGNLDQLAPTVGAKKNRRDGTWQLPLGGASRDYTITILPPGSNKDVCQAEVHYAIGGDSDIYKAINIWSFLHKPELLATANYVQTGPDNIKRVQRSWEHLESASSTAVNFTTWKKPDDTSLNKGYDTGMLFYQERKL